MTVTRGQIVSRGLRNQCPNCGAATLFPPGMSFKINERCGSCRLKFDRGEGFFLGPFVINYTLTVAGFIVPVILLNVRGVLGTTATVTAAALGATLIPVLLYRRSWGWWLMAYFYFLPQKLSANSNELHEDQEE